MLLGCIADDFTGATDLANTLVRQGISTVVLLGVPGGRAPDEGRCHAYAYGDGDQ